MAYFTNKLSLQINLKPRHTQHLHKSIAIRYENLMKFNAFARMLLSSVHLFP